MSNPLDGNCEVLELSRIFQELIHGLVSALDRDDLHSLCANPILRKRASECLNSLFRELLSPLHPEIFQFPFEAIDVKVRPEDCATPPFNDWNDLNGKEDPGRDPIPCLASLADVSVELRKQGKQETTHFLISSENSPTSETSARHGKARRRAGGQKKEEGNVCPSAGAAMDINRGHCCDLCGKVVRSVLDHKRSVHFKERNYICQHCASRFATAQNLYQHRKVMHSSEKKFMCDVCGYKCALKWKLRVHVNRHEGKRPFVCHVCNKAFPESKDLTRHKRVHTAEKLHLCTECGCTLSRRQYLRDHLRTKHGIVLDGYKQSERKEGFSTLETDLS